MLARLKTQTERSAPEWRAIARPSQLPPPGAWRIWLILAGRGWGKTRTGAEWFRLQSRTVPILRIVAPTYADARDTCVEGESGLRAICGPGELVKWNRSIGEGEFSNGARFKLFSGDTPDRLRGPQSYADWYDELGAWQYQQEAWDMAMMGLRLGNDPRAVVTTTPRPTALIRSLAERNGRDVAVTRGATYENRDNLAAAFFEQIVSRYAGTRQGRQEIDAEILDDAPGALWKRMQLDKLRVSVLPELARVVVGVDPSATKGGDEAGVVAAGLGKDGHGYVLEDASLQGSPDQWARAAVAAYHKHGGDRLIAESNNGGEMVSLTIQTIPGAPPVKLIHASRSKQARAEPIVALYEQGRVHHVGYFSHLEDEQCGWEPTTGAPSPNRLDALVWALTELMVAPGIVTTVNNPFYD